MIRGYTMYVRFGALGVGLGVGLGWFGAFACSFIAFAFGIWNPCMRAPFGCSGRGWFGVGLGLVWLGLGLVWLGSWLVSLMFLKKSKLCE